MLEMKKLEVEIMKVSAAREEQTMRIMEKEFEIERIRENIVLQEKHIEKIKKDLSDLKIKKGV
jgi:hypothetical protein